MKTVLFKTCTNCSKPWETMEDFLSDPDLRMGGYQVAFEDLEGGLFFFTHLHKECGTTLAIPVGAFTSLSTRPLLTSRGEQMECCPGLCVRHGALDPCPMECECVWVREIMQIICNWKKQAA